MIRMIILCYVFLYFHSLYQLNIFSVYELLCYVWKELHSLIHDVCCVAAGSCILDAESKNRKWFKFKFKSGFVEYLSGQHPPLSLILPQTFIIKTDFHPQIMDKLFQLSFTYKINEIIFSFFPNSSSSIFLQSYTWGLIWILYHHIMWFAFCNHYTM